MKIAYGFVLFFVLGLTSLAWGCSCKSMEWEEQFSRAEGVFYGQLLDGPVVLNYEDKYVSTHQYTFQVFEAWKGVQSSPVTIATSSSSSLCGTTFRRGTPYVILVNESDGYWSTGLCAGNVLGDQAVDLRKKIRSDYPTIFSGTEEIPFHIGFLGVIENISNSIRIMWIQLFYSNNN